jgi:hypothetical protein
MPDETKRAVPGEATGRDLNAYDRMSRLAPRGEGRPGGESSEFAPDADYDHPAGYLSFRPTERRPLGYSPSRAADAPASTSDRGDDLTRRR